MQRYLFFSLYRTNDIFKTALYEYYNHKLLKQIFVLKRKSFVLDLHLVSSDCDHFELICSLVRDVKEIYVEI